ncbi:MAG TPA: metalloregulator ArsR/SmtB family transcription factor [Burkholderiales bacterium]|nr:metalloregulator ArsR/SmtB family transcription factor [Burkholderiales bacterium]
MSGTDLAELQINASRAAALLKLMGNPSRLLILCQLSEGEKSVSELERVIGVSQSALSQHLALLRHQNVVSTRRDAQTIYYSLAGREASAVLATLYELFCSGSAKPRSRRLKTGPA